eukprot:771342-Amphidinium_carterae.1
MKRSMLRQQIVNTMSRAIFLCRDTDQRLADAWVSSACAFHLKPSSAAKVDVENETGHCLVWFLERGLNLMMIAARAGRTSWINIRCLQIEDDVWKKERCKSQCVARSLCSIAVLPEEQPPPPAAACGCVALLRRH